MSFCVEFDGVLHLLSHRPRVTYGVCEVIIPDPTTGELCAIGQEQSYKPWDSPNSGQN